MPVSEDSIVPAAADAGAATPARPEPPPQTLLVCVSGGDDGSLPGQLTDVLAMLQAALQPSAAAIRNVTVIYPGQSDTASEQDGFHLQPYPQHDAGSITVQTAATWLRLADAMRAHGATAGLLLGAEAQSLAPATLGGLADVVLRRGIDLAVPRYALPPNQGLLNQAMLAPLSRALFGGKVRFPLPLDAGFSLRMAERMAVAAQRVPAASQSSAILWPVDEAAVAGFDLAEIGNSTRDLPPTTSDLAHILRDVAGSLFSDIEAKATFWQRTRPQRETLRVDTVASPGAVENAPPSDTELDDLITSFRIGYSNLHDIWSLVLPPQTLVSLKRLSQAPRDSFNMTDAVWVRIVYDFVLAHRLRTLSRSHLLGALTPLYLAWVASHLLAVRNGTASRPGQLGRAFESDRPYLVSRWRWPDRFNP